MTKRKRVEPRNIAMYPTDWSIVDRVSKQLGMDNTSAATRYIVRDWNRRISDELNASMLAQAIPLEVTP